MPMNLQKVILLFVAIWLLSGCATLYQRTAEYQTAISKGDFEQAEHILQKDKSLRKDKNKILYQLNQGYIQFMLGNRVESNQAFEAAETLIDDQLKNPLTEAAVLISNPEIRPYKPENFEVVMINFYKTMNYLNMDNMEAALVEVRKINIKLNKLNDKYPDHKNRYQRDAFAHLLMGLIYDASKDYNNAFIAYRNAYETYNTDYIQNFNVAPPLQLKKDLLRTASLTGFTAELTQYEKEFEMKYTPEPTSDGGNLVLFWLNGMGPVKAEWGVDFIKQKRGDGAVVFHNEELGLAFPFFFGLGYNDSDRNSIANLKIIRAVFPKYVERPPLYTQATVTHRNNSYRLELAEDINAIAFKTLHDRMLREFSSSLLRLAVKQGINYAASQQNEWLGLAVNIANGLTEKADTRNWQTLPYAISYIRIPLQSGENKMNFQLSPSPGGDGNQVLNFDGKPHKTLFSTFSSL